jgi:hypothetical protein
MIDKKFKEYKYINENYKYLRDVDDRKKELYHQIIKKALKDYKNDIIKEDVLKDKLQIAYVNKLDISKLNEIKRNYDEIDIIRLEMDNEMDRLNEMDNEIDRIIDRITKENIPKERIIKENEIKDKNIQNETQTQKSLEDEIKQIVNKIKDIIFKKVYK